MGLFLKLLKLSVDGLTLKGLVLFKQLNPNDHIVISACQNPQICK